VRTLTGKKEAILHQFPSDTPLFGLFNPDRSIGAAPPPGVIFWGEGAPEKGQKAAWSRERGPPARGQQDELTKKHDRERKQPYILCLKIRCGCPGGNKPCPNGIYKITSLWY
jgi:hypothetical protein